MKTLFAAGLVAISVALGGCGGGGDSPAAPESAASAPVAKAADVTFVNVPTTRGTTVMPGQKDFAAVGFLLKWLEPNGSRGRIAQLVFRNKVAGVNLVEAFRGFKLGNSDGVDIQGIETSYEVRVYNDMQQVVVDFYAAPWYPHDFGAVPKTYWFMPSMDPSTAPGTEFAFELVDVQMHDADKTVTSEVKGDTLSVIKVAGAGLPTVTALTTAWWSFAEQDVGIELTVGLAEATCPADNVYACVLTKAVFNAYGISDPQLYINGVNFSSVQTGPNMYAADVWYYMYPGQKVMLMAVATVYQPDVYITMDTTWEVYGVKVVPIVADDCGMFVSTNKGCKG